MADEQLNGIEAREDIPALVSRKTIADVYELGRHNPVVYAGLTLYKQSEGKMPMFDALTAIVCALADENRALKARAIWMAENTVVPVYPNPESYGVTP